MPTRSPPNHNTHNLVIMATQGNKVEESSDDKLATTISQAEVGCIGKIGERYYKTKADAEAYPYVWDRILSCMGDLDFGLLTGGESYGGLRTEFEFFKIDYAKWLKLKNPQPLPVILKRTLI